MINEEGLESAVIQVAFVFLNLFALMLGVLLGFAKKEADE